MGHATGEMPLITHLSARPLSDLRLLLRRGASPVSPEFSLA
jgi:hypothetical protein